MVNIFKVVIAVTVLLALLALVFLGKRMKKILMFDSAVTLRSESRWAQTVTGLLVLLVGLSYYLKNEPEVSAVMWGGVAVYFSGGILHIIARRQLGNYDTFEELFPTRKKQKGLYNHVRYPSKTACLLMLIGLCFAFGSFWAMALLLVLFLPALVFRASQEDRSMLDKFGDDFLVYQSDTKRIIPGIL